MAKTDFKSAQEYIDTFPENIQKILQTVRRVIKKAVPEAEEVISYQIPAFKFHGWIFYYSAYKEHYSLSCPPPFTVFEEFASDLSQYKRSKSTIRFPLNEPVPEHLIEKMVKYQAEENLKREKKNK